MWIVATNNRDGEARVRNHIAGSALLTVDAITPLGDYCDGISTPTPRSKQTLQRGHKQVPQGTWQDSALFKLAQNVPLPYWFYRSLKCYI
jgi:hypothetical protein